MAVLSSRSYLRVTVDGENITRALLPWLISVRVREKQSEVNQATIEIDDSNGQMAIPTDGAPVEIAIGRMFSGEYAVFEGVVSEPESAFTRESGRLLFIEARGADMAGPGKSSKRQAWGTGTDGQGNTDSVKLSDVLSDAAKAAGFEIDVDEKFASIERAFWQQSESFFHFGKRLATELGGIFSIAGNKAVFTDAMSGKTASGQAMTTIDAIWGENLISWRIKPLSARPMYAKAMTEWFDRAEGIWKIVEKSIGGGGQYRATASALARIAAATEEGGNQLAGGVEADSSRKRGTGWVIIDGNGQTRAGGTMNVKGARPGVDGSYLMEEVEHSWSRGTGYLTRADVVLPGSTVGVDSRGGEAWQT